MTVYRRRLASSFEAIKKSLTRRLHVCCAIPPQNVVDEPNRLASPEDAGTSAAATVTPVGVPGGMSIGQVVGLMFGGY